MEYKTEGGQFLIKLVKEESDDLQVVFYIGKIEFTGYRKIPTSPAFKVPLGYYFPSKKMMTAAVEYIKKYFLSRPQARLL